MGRPLAEELRRLTPCISRIAGLAAVALACGSPATDRPAAGYAGIVAAAESERSRLADEWRVARSPAEEKRALARASAALGRILADRILPAWNGTPWSLSGTARAPGDQPIACGHFVSAALADAGLGVERTILARQAAEHIVVTLVPADRIARSKRAPLAQFLAETARGGDGVYIVGLDRHVGFLVIDRGRAFFHHSSRHAGAVVREPAILSDALASSSYRVAGKLSGPELARAWLTGAPIRTQKPGRPDG